MTKRVLRFRQINKDTFDAIKDGKKTVETRAGTSKYQTLKTGDTLVCVCGTEKLEKIIKSVSHFPDLDSLFSTINFHQISPNKSSLAVAKEEYKTYPGYEEKIKKFGILAFQL